MTGGWGVCNEYTGSMEHESGQNTMVGHSNRQGHQREVPGALG